MQTGIRHDTSDNAFLPVYSIFSEQFKLFKLTDYLTNHPTTPLLTKPRPYKIWLDEHN